MYIYTTTVTTCLPQVANTEIRGLVQQKTTLDIFILRLNKIDKNKYIFCSFHQIKFSKF